MNIEEAKKQVKYAVISYLSKDEFGEYRIPVERQRPIFSWVLRESGRRIS